MYRLFYFIIVAFIITIYGCTTDKWNVDTSQITTNQKFLRFEKDLFQIPTDSVWEYIPILEKKYGDFFDAYNNQVIKIGSTSQLNYHEKLVNFLTDPHILAAYKDIQRLYEKLPFEKEIQDAFKRIKYHFPEKEIPSIYTHISGFNQSIIIDSVYMSISLDKYLGTDSRFYKMLRTPHYLRQNMTPEKIASDVIFSYGITEFPINIENPTLIDEMIYYGKIQLLLDATLPKTPDTLKWGISQDKLNWCLKNERKMWLYLVENKLLFTTSYKQIKRYIDDGPFTSTFSKEAPAKTGRWLGYQIVLAYYKKHPELTLHEFLINNNHQQILNQSKYKP